MGSEKKGVFFIIGTGLIRALPLIIKSLALIGTLALLLVSGGIFNHNIDYLQNFLIQFPGVVRDFISGLLIGIVCLVVVKIVKSFIPSKTKSGSLQ
jgi:predicted DNA repair protein MutK